MWASEGLDTSLVLADPSRNPGLYAITTDAAGERSFTYWRGDSAARAMFTCEGIDRALLKAATAELLGFSLITLAILEGGARRQIFALAREVRDRGGRVAFDGNYRPHLWSDSTLAIAMRDEAIACCDIGFPTLADETALSSASDAASVARHWSDLGCTEVVVKLGEEGCRLPDGEHVPPPTVLQPVDTSGAGDAFNGGYLAARLQGASVKEAARAGNALAGWCVMRRGAIPPADHGRPSTELLP